MSEDEPEFFSPFDSFDGSGIDGYVIDAQDGDPRLHGYAIGGDLARHYNFAEVLYLALCGDFPTPGQVRMFEVALAGAMMITVGDASVHGARLAQHLAHASQNPAAVVPASFVGTAEMSRTQVEEHPELFVWLADPTGPVPREALAAEPDPFVELLRAGLPDELGLNELFDAQPTLIAAVIGMLWACGLQSPALVTAALVTARGPVAVAEAVATPQPQLGRYPLNLPFWDYHHERKGDD